MKSSNPVFLLLLIAALAWAACGDSTSSSDAESRQTATLVSLTEPGRSVQLKELPVQTPESVIGDGKYFYVSCIGREPKPFDTDGDGFIMKLDQEGNVISEKFIQGLDAPKGSAIVEGILYVADITEIKAFDLLTGQPKGTIDLSSTGTRSLNDLTPMKGKLIVSATDINRIYEVSPTKGTFAEIATRPTLVHPNGVWYDETREKLYITTSPTEPTGHLNVINMAKKRGEVYFAETVGTYSGILDGLAIVGDYAFFSDWHRQTVVVMNTHTGETSGAGLPQLVQGPADFFLDIHNREIWLPGMMENSLSIQTLPMTIEE